MNLKDTEDDSPYRKLLHTRIIQYYSPISLFIKYVIDAVAFQKQIQRCI